MNTETIGMYAGSVWVALNTAEAMGIKQLKKPPSSKTRKSFAAIGWLARENKINILPDPDDEKEFIVSLVQDR